MSNVITNVFSILKGFVGFTRNFTTVADAKADKFLRLGQKISIDERGGAVFAVSLVESADEYRVLTCQFVNAVLKLEKKGRLLAEWFGVVGDGVTDNSAAIESALGLGENLHFCSGVFLVNNVVVPDTVNIYAAGESTVFKKNADGFIFDLGRYGEINGGVFNGNFLGGGYFGSGIVIDRGENSSTVANQGHQRVIDSSFLNSDSYHVITNALNGGYMNRLVRCKFLEKPVNAPASVKWPDEPALGGNRYIDGGYSICPIVNVSGCDNGAVIGVVTGSDDNTTDQGIYFDSSAVNPPRKIVVVGNRFAIGGKSLNVRGIEHVFNSNIIAGDIVFDVGAQGNVFSNDNVLAGGHKVTNNNGLINYVYDHKAIFYTPVVFSGVTLGDATLQGEFKRLGDSVEFRIEMDIGITTEINGTIVFNLPVNVVSGGTRRFLGNAWGDDYAGVANIEQSTGRVTVNNSATRAIWGAVVPKAWVNGDKIIIEGRYRI